MRASNAPDSPWMVFNYDPVTMKTTLHQYVSTPGGGFSINVRETIPMWLAERMLEENKQKAKLFTENGGWAGARHGAVVANVPDHVDAEFKRLSGWDPTVSGWYDHDKYNSFLDDSDYASLRTGGGKIGKRVIETPLLPSARKVAAVK